MGGIVGFEVLGESSEMEGWRYRRSYFKRGFIDDVEGYGYIL